MSVGYPHRSVPSQSIDAFLVAATVPPFAGAALADCAYRNTYQVQWLDFASWLLTGGLVFAVAALVVALVGRLRTNRDDRSPVFPFVMLLAVVVLGVLDALVHARDAWASMPTGLLLSVIVAVLALVTAWIEFSGSRYREMP